MAEVPINAGRRAAGRRQAPSQGAVPARGVTSREGAVHTRPGFREAGPGCQPTARASPLSPMDSHSDCCYFWMFVYVLSLIHPGGFLRSFPKSGSPQKNQAPQKKTGSPVSIPSPFLTQQRVLRVAAQQHLLLLLAETFPGTKSSVVIPPTPPHPHTEMLSLVSACLRLTFCNFYFSVRLATLMSSP